MKSCKNICIFRWLCRNPDLISLRCCQVKQNFTLNLIHTVVSLLLIIMSFYLFFTLHCYYVMLSSFVTPLDKFFKVVPSPSFFIFLKKIARRTGWERLFAMIRRTLIYKAKYSVLHPGVLV
jgi:hypothetical protein